MMGIARPGIAPTHPGDAAPAPPLPAAVAPEVTAAMAPRRAPMKTVVMPVDVVPLPAPLPDLPAPPRLRVVAKKGFSLSTVALTAAGLLLAGGMTIAFLWKSAPPITALPRATREGGDVLHLVCDRTSCKDGTLVAFDGAKATFAAGEADLALTTPLHVGDNELALVVDRPGMGRDETVKLVVPVAYRLRADVSTMAGPRPNVTIRVEAQSGTDVRIDDKPVPLDASGAGAYAIDESAATEGPADESRLVSLDATYTIVPKGRPAEKGTVSARVVVAPLRVDAPGTRLVLEDDRVIVAGRAAKGATVSVDGAAAAVRPDGSFEATVPLLAIGDRTIDIRGGTDSLMPRTVHVSVSRVASLTDAAKAFEQRGPIGYDATMSDLEGKTGQPIVVDGEVLDARSVGHRSVIVVDDKRGCSRGPCLARVLLGRDVSVDHGASLRAYGVVARGFTSSPGQTVPEVDAEFVIGTSQAMRRTTSGAVVLAAAAIAAGAAAQTVNAERPRTLVVGTPAHGARSDRVDPARTGRSWAKLPTADLKTEWRVSLGALIERTPVVDARGTSYVVGTRGEVVAVARDGVERWRVATGALQPGPAALLTDDTLVFVDAGGTAVAVQETSAREGAVRWRAHFGRNDTVHAAPIPLDDGGIVVATSHDLAALDSDGHERARTTLPEATSVPLVSAVGRVIAVTASGAVWAWTPGAAEATRLGSFDAPVDGGAALADEHTLVAITADQAHLAAVDLLRGTMTTRAVAPTGLWLGPPAMRGGVAYLLAATPVGELALGVDATGTEVSRAVLTSHAPAVAADGGVFALVAGPHTAPLVDAAGVVAFATSDGSLGVATSAGTERIADACAPTLARTGGGGAVPAAAVAGLAPLGPGVFVAACHSGTLVAVHAAGAAAPAPSGERSPPPL